MWIGTYIRETLHIKPLFVVAPIIPIIALLAGAPVVTSLLLGVGYFVWALPAWGRWFDLGNLPDEYNRTEGKYADPLERWIDWYAETDMQAMFLRHGIVLFAVCVALSCFSTIYLIMWPIWTSGIILAYIIGWTYAPAAPILVAELLVGAVWGAMVCMPSI